MNYHGKDCTPDTECPGLFFDNERLKEDETMTNCKEEFLEHVKNRDILCVSLQHGSSYDDDDCKKTYFLPKGFSEPEYQTFLQAIDFKYDSGYGGQELHGLIWYKDGTWSSRGTYDGSEWWVHNVCPEIPTEAGGFI